MNEEISLSNEELDYSIPETTEVWEPEPEVVTPEPSTTLGMEPPEGAIVLGPLDWIHEKSRKSLQWTADNGVMTVVAGTGDIETKRLFGDMKLHLEWRTPEVIEGEGQGRGNSGVFFQKRYEVQILDSYENRTYSNGQAAAIYKQFPPLVNACLPPGQWQTYDITFKAPQFDDDGNRTSAGRLTVIQNGVTVQDDVELLGTTEYIGLPLNIAHGNDALKLQDHGNPVSFRNIWVEEM